MSLYAILLLHNHAVVHTLGVSVGKRKLYESDLVKHERRVRLIEHR